MLQQKLLSMLSRTLCKQNLLSTVLTVLPGYFPSSNIFAPVPQPSSEVYTDVDTQIYTVEILHKVRLSQGWVGDTGKLAARLYDMVARTGVAKGLTIGEGDKRYYNKIPFGNDSGIKMRERLGKAVENVDVLRVLWSSTDTDVNKLHSIA